MVITLLQKPCGTSAPAGMLAAVLIALAATLAAQPVAAAEPRWQTLDEALAQSQRHDRIWRFGWGGFHGANLGRNIYLASEGSDSATRFDARVDSVKSMLALGTLLLESPPYTAARHRLQDLRAAAHPDSLHRAEQIVAETARIEALRRQPSALAGALAVNIAAGAAIALGDDRTADGLRNAALGMTVSAIQVWTRPSAVERAQPGSGPAAGIPGGQPPRLHYRVAIGPSQAAVALHW